MSLYYDEDADDYEVCYWKVCMLYCVIFRCVFVCILVCLVVVFVGGWFVYLMCICYEYMVSIIWFVGLAMCFNKWCVLCDMWLVFYR